MSHLNRIAILLFATSLGTGTAQAQALQTIDTSTARPAQAVTKNTRVAPRHVYEKQLAGQNGIHVPRGYKAAWSDDRLSRTRQHQTLAGKGKMDLIWTQTVPRRLIKVNLPRD